MGVVAVIKSLFKRAVTVDEATACFRQIIQSFEDPSFVNGYDDNVQVYLRMRRRRLFSNDEVKSILTSAEFKSAIMDLDRYDLDLTDANTKFPEVNIRKGENVKFADDQIYTDNFVYLRFMAESIIANRGLTFYQIVLTELLLGAEYGAMRKVGCALHFIVNYACEFEDSFAILSQYNESFNSKKSEEFFKDFCERIRK